MNLSVLLCAVNTSRMVCLVCPLPLLFPGEEAWHKRLRHTVPITLHAHYMGASWASNHSPRGRICLAKILHICCMLLHLLFLRQACCAYVLFCSKAFNVQGTTFTERALLLYHMVVSNQKNDRCFSSFAQPNLAIR